MHDYELLRWRPTDKEDHDDEDDEDDDDDDDGGGRVPATSTSPQHGAFNQQPSCRTCTHRKQEKFIG